MYFKDSELECHCKECEGKGTAVHFSPLLREHLEKLREMYGHPIIVECGYRCPKHNEEVGGVPNSYHTQGLAADIWVGEPNDYSEKAVKQYEQFYKTILDSALFDAVGHYSKQLFVHVDMRHCGRFPNSVLFEGDEEEE